MHHSSKKHVECMLIPVADGNKLAHGPRLGRKETKAAARKYRCAASKRKGLKSRAGKAAQTC